MATRLILRPLAERDIEEAQKWYEEQEAGLGTRFLETVHARMADLRSNPERFPRIDRRLRRAMLRHFPYAVFFTVTDETIHVVACMHGHRHPARWLRRG